MRQSVVKIIADIRHIAFTAIPRCIISVIMNRLPCFGRGARHKRGLININFTAVSALIADFACAVALQPKRRPHSCTARNNDCRFKISVRLRKQDFRFSVCHTARLNPACKNPLGHTADIAIMIISLFTVHNQTIFSEFQHIVTPILHIALGVRRGRPICGKELFHIFNFRKICM